MAVSLASQKNGKQDQTLSFSFPVETRNRAVPLLALTPISSASQGLKFGSVLAWYMTRVHFAFVVNCTKEEACHWTASLE